MASSLTSPVGISYRGSARSTAQPAIAFLLLLFFAPLLVLIGGWVLLESHGPITIQRAVAGSSGQVVYVTEFRLWRLLDMDDAGPAEHPRLRGPKPDTMIGRVLQITRLSRLPRLLDVKAGRLSLADAYWA